MGVGHTYCDPLILCYGALPKWGFDAVGQPNGLLPGIRPCPRGSTGPVTG